jgi:hypothetical protein
MGNENSTNQPPGNNNRERRNTNEEDHTNRNIAIGAVGVAAGGAALAYFLSTRNSDTNAREKIIVK